MPDARNPKRPLPLPKRLDLVSEDKALPTALSSSAPVDTKTRDERTDQDFIADALDRWQQTAEAERDQRAREKDDLKFDRALLEDHWPEDILRARRGGVGADGRPIPARPTLVINKLDQPVQQVINEARSARLGILIKAKGENATKDGAELRQGMIRAIEVDSNAPYARLWALERAVKCGRGYYRVVTEYANDGDFDLDILIEAIHNQGTVYLDPNAVKPDGSDAEFAFIVDDIPAAEYTRRYPKSKLARSKGGRNSDIELQSDTDVPAGWLEDDHTRIAEYFYVEHETLTLYYDVLLETKGNKVIVDEQGNQFDTDFKPLLEPVEIPTLARKRDVDRRRVKRAVINAFEVLSRDDWPGRWIPIIPVLGKKYVVDGEDVTYKGMVGNAKDAARLYDYGVSSQAEAMGLTNKAPYILDPKQIAGWEPYWHQANVTNLPFLPAREYDDQGRKYSVPARNIVEPAMQGLVQITMQADADIKATTGRFDPSLGSMKTERSGKAIEALKAQGENSSSNYLDNLATVAMVHEARILLDLMPHIYDRPGRIIRLLGEEDTDERHVMLGKPFVLGPDGLPVEAPPLPPRMPAGPPAPAGPPMGPPMPPGAPGPMPGALPPGAGPMPVGPPSGPPPPPPEPPKVYSLEGGEYTVTITVGQSAKTQKEASAMMIQQVIEASDGQAAPFLLDLWAENAADGIMAKKIAKRLRLANPALAQLDENGQNAPPELLAQLQQMQQQLQQAQQAIATEQHKVEAQAQIEMAKSQAQSEIKAREMEFNAQLERERAAAQADLEREKVRLDLEKVRLEADLKLRLQNDQQEHEFALKRLELEMKAQLEKEVVLIKVNAEREIASMNAAVTRESEQESAANERDAQIRDHQLQRESQAQDHALKRDTQERDHALKTQAQERDHAMQLETQERDHTVAIDKAKLDSETKRTVATAKTPPAGRE